MSSPCYIGLSAGCGGLSTGLIKAGFMPILLNDKDPDSTYTLINNHPEAKVFCGCFEDIDYTQYVNKVDLMTIETSSFRRGGKDDALCRSWDETRSSIIIKFGVFHTIRRNYKYTQKSLMLKIIDLIHFIKPKIFLIEGLFERSTLRKKSLLENTLKTIEDMKEYSATYKIFDTFTKKRVFIVGTCEANIYSFPEISLHVVESFRPTKDVKELATIQGFPEGYAPENPGLKIYRQIEKAVPVDLAYHIGLSLEKALQTIKCNDFLNSSPDKEYFTRIKNRIEESLSNPEPFEDNDEILCDLYMDDFARSWEFKMKIREIWMICIEEWVNYRNSETSEKKIMLKLRRKSNSVAEERNLEKLAIFKKENPDYICIYGVLNETKPRLETIYVPFGKEKFRVLIRSGNKLIESMLGTYVDYIIELTKILLL